MVLILESQKVIKIFNFDRTIKLALNNYRNGKKNGILLPVL